VHWPKTFLCVGLAMLAGGLWAFYALLFQAPLAPGLAERMQLLISR
jgi:hypothetical protein